MDHKKSPIRRQKRQSKVLEDFWDCSVCTYRNTAEAFKCLMCDVRKGKSSFSTFQIFCFFLCFFNWVKVLKKIKFISVPSKMFCDYI